MEKRLFVLEIVSSDLTEKENREFEDTLKRTLEEKFEIDEGISYSIEEKAWWLWIIVN